MAGTFERKERKYMLTEEVFRALYAELSRYASKDKYGEQTIASIYFDTEDGALIRNAIEGSAYKEKLRIRSYGVPSPDDKVYVELKKKYLGTVYKRRIECAYRDAVDHMDGSYRIMPDSGQLANEIDYLLRSKRIKPAIFIAYDRIALYAKEDKGLRITFDYNLRSRETELDLAKGSMGEPYFEREMYIMEVKTDSAIPLWLVKFITEYKLYPISFSKYGKIYQKKYGKGELGYV